MASKDKKNNWAIFAAVLSAIVYIVASIKFYFWKKKRNEVLERKTEFSLLEKYKELLELSLKHQKTVDQRLLLEKKLDSLEAELIEDKAKLDQGLLDLMEEKERILNAETWEELFP